MRHVLFTLIGFLYFIHSLHAQDEEELRERLEFHIMPVALADYTPRLRLGMEYNPDKKWGYVLDVGIGNYALNKGRLQGMIWGEDYSLYELRP